MTTKKKPKMIRKYRALVGFDYSDGEKDQRVEVGDVVPLSASLATDLGPTVIEEVK